MVVPDWLKTDANCDELVNMFVVGIEYINRNNLLLTTQACAPRDVNIYTGLVDAEKCEYRYYFVHPNRADCTDPGQEDDLAIFTCWRADSIGMFIDRPDVITTVSEPNRMCPELQRMPQMGSMFAELTVATSLVLRLFFNMICTLPAAAATGGVVTLFMPHEKLAFHLVLDSEGDVLVEFEDIIFAVQRSHHHMWNSLGIQCCRALSSLPLSLSSAPLALHALLPARAARNNELWQSTQASSRSSSAAPAATPPSRACSSGRRRCSSTWSAPQSLRAMHSPCSCASRPSAGQPKRPRRRLRPLPQ